MNGAVGKILIHLNSGVRICSDDDTLHFAFNLLTVLGILGMFFYFSYSISVQRVLYSLGSLSHS